MKTITIELTDEQWAAVEQRTAEENKSVDLRNKRVDLENDERKARGDKNHFEHEPAVTPEDFIKRRVNATFEAEVAHCQQANAEEVRKLTEGLSREEVKAALEALRGK